jgi:cytochrome bd-type quinol oxidase subunit 2
VKPVLSHFLLMVLYALIVSLFFTLLWRRGRKEQIKLFLQIFLGMVGGGLLVAWLMYPFPSGPPAPIP